jgi:hypothetical protein
MVQPLYAHLHLNQLLTQSGAKPVTVGDTR